MVRKIKIQLEKDYCIPKLEGHLLVLFSRNKSIVIPNYLDKPYKTSDIAIISSLSNDPLVVERSKMTKKDIKVMKEGSDVKID
jgi:hypothetical protein